MQQPQTAVSQHLAKLRLAGLVRGRREGTFIHYSAADAHLRALLTEALAHSDRNGPGHRGSGTGEDPVPASSSDPQ